jgi:hypothetical protein
VQRQPLVSQDIGEDRGYLGFVVRGDAVECLDNRDTGSQTRE